MKKHAILFGLIVIMLSCTKVQKSVDARFRLISYNVWYGFTQMPERKSQWLEWMKEQAPDIVSLQELNGYTPAQLKSDALTWGHEHSVLLKEDGFPTGLTSRFVIEDVQIYREGFHHGLIRVKIRGIYFYIIHLHPSNWEFRLREMEHILADIQTLPKKSSILLVGDFNTFSRYDAPFYSHGELEPFFRARDVEYNEKNLQDGALAYSVLDQLMQAGFIDLEYQNRRADDPFTGSFPTKIAKPDNQGSSRRLDYAFATPDLARRLKRAEIVANERTWFLSDHLPLLIIVE